MDVKDFSFRKLQFEELLTLISWAKNEGWNPGLYDAEVFWKTDPDGFYGVFDNDILVGGGAIVSYNSHFGFMGLFIMHPDYRGHGMGRKLWELRKSILLKRLHKGAAIGMDGVVAMQAFYSEGGFEISFRDERYENTGFEIEFSKFVSSVQSEDLEGIFKLDTKCFGFERKVFLKGWLNLKDSFKFVYKNEQGIKGFVVLRKATIGYKIGPLFATSFSVAEALYKACLNSVPEQKIYIDIPVINDNARKLVDKYKATYVFECARMYYNKTPLLEMDSVYGITSFELG